MAHRKPKKNRKAHRDKKKRQQQQQQNLFPKRCHKQRDKLSTESQQYFDQLCRRRVRDFVPLFKVVHDVIDLMEDHDEEWHEHFDPQMPTELKNGDFLTDPDWMLDDFIKPLWQESINIIRAELADEQLFLAVSNSVFKRSQCYHNQIQPFLNVIVGSLSWQGKIFLLDSQPVDTIWRSEKEEIAFCVKLIWDAMKLLYPENAKEWIDHVRLLVLKPKQQKVGEVFKALNPQLLTLTCLDGIMRELERCIIEHHGYEEFLFLDALEFEISTRGRLEFCHNVGLQMSQLPRSNSYECNLMEWIEFIEQHFDKLRQFFHDWPEWSNKPVIRDDQTRKTWTFLTQRFSSISDTRRRLQNEALPIPVKEVLDGLEPLRRKLNKCSDVLTRKVSRQLNSLLKENSGFMELSQLVQEDSEGLYAEAPLVALSISQCFPRFAEMLQVYEDLVVQPHLLNYLAPIYCTYEMTARRANDTENQ